MSGSAENGVEGHRSSVGELSPAGALRLVAFDLDGTLVDSLGDIAGAMNGALREHGFEEHEPERYIEWVGDGAGALARRALAAEVAGDEGLAGKVAISFRRHYQLGGHRRSRPYAGVAEMLTSLREVGVVLAVISNKPHELVEGCVEEVFGGGVFARVLGQKDGAPPKPDPSGLLGVMDELGVDRSRTAYVGDSMVDVETARRAGVAAVAVSWGFCGRGDLLAAHPHVMADSPDEILSFVVNYATEAGGAGVRSV